MGYDHRQRAPTYLLVGVPGLVGVVYALATAGGDAVSIVLLVTGCAMVLLATGIMWLSVRDEGEFLAVRFGPLPLFRTRVRIATIREVRRERSRLLDGWGIHWAPDRGWIWNLWGRECVALQMEGGRIRIGTDDPEGLVQHLQDRIGGGDA